MHSVMVNVSRESYTRRRPRAVVDGSPENERVVAGEAPARDGVEGMMERIGGRGSERTPIPVEVSPRVSVACFLTS